ncbi:MAG: hypothetical protein R3F56_23370 [Planctomycetota bacterium]
MTRLRVSAPGAVLLAALTLSGIARAQGIRALTNNTSTSVWSAHVRISPDGLYVYYDLGTVWHLDAWDGSLRTTVPLIEGVWSRTSSAIYGSRTTDVVERLAVPSLTLSLVGNVPGLVGLLGTDAAGTNLFGLRTNAANARVVFRLPTSGGAPVDLATLPNFGFAHAVDPTGTTLLAVHSPRPFVSELIAVDLTTGSMRTIATHMAILSAVFADGYRAAACEFFDPVAASGRADIVFTPVNGSGNPIVISNGSAPVAADPSAQMLAFPDYDPLAYETPVVMDSRGGGQVFLDGGRWLSVSAISMSGNGRVAFAAAETVNSQFLPPQVYVAELDRELGVSPLPALGGPARLELPLRAGEAGAIALSTGVALPTTIPGFGGQLFLDSSLLVVAAGVGSGSAPLAVTFSLPNDPVLEGRPFFLQGVRVDPGLNRSELTRLAQLMVPFPR